MKSAEESADKYDEEKDRDLVVDDDGVRDEAKDWIFSAGQSKRIWNERYKVGILSILKVLGKSVGLCKTTK